MTRALTSAVQAAVASPNVGLVIFVEMLFDSAPLRLCTAGYDVVWNGVTWSGVGTVGEVQPIREAEGGEVSGLSFSISGVPSSYVAQALGELYQGRLVRIYVGFLDLPSHAILADPVLEWAGRLDTMQLQDNGGTASIVVNAENELYDFDRPLVLMWSNEVQQARYPGDRGLEYIPQMAERQIVWPSADFFKQ